MALTFEKKLRIASIKRKLIVDMDSMRRNVCKLMAHKDATPEQIDEARAMLQRIEEKLKVVREAAVKHNIKVNI